MNRICNRCKQEKDYSEFNKNTSGKNGYYSICRLCTRDQYAERPPYDRFKHVHRKYGLTKEAFESLLESQEHKCKICDKELKSYSLDSKRQLAIDHCHTTKKVRGLLCHHCNIGLGMFKDNTETMTRAIKYLDENKQHN